MQLRFIIAIFFIGLLGRLLPHPESFTPIHALCILTGMYLPISLATTALLASYCCADIMLALNSDFSIFGSWSFYSYSGLCALIYLGSKISYNRLSILVVLMGSVGFWAWANFGVWLHSGMYLNTITGLMECYLAAIPFLQKAMLGDAIWFITLSAVMLLIDKIDKNGFSKKLYPTL